VERGSRKPNAISCIVNARIYTVNVHACDHFLVNEICRCLNAITKFIHIIMPYYLYFLKYMTSATKLRLKFVNNVNGCRGINF